MFLPASLHLAALLVMPLLLVGVIRKVKAWMQNRTGAPVMQPLFDVAKLLRKGETVSDTASWVFRTAPAVSLAVALGAALAAPWTGSPQPVEGRWADLLLIVYLLALGKFFGMLAALDTGSAFGGLGASREATLSLLAEPVVVIGLGALAVSSGTTDLQAVFAGELSPFVAIPAGCALAVASLVELSRMPVDDPTTHLELTMVHEAMVLENSGRNLAFMEIAAALRTSVFLGLTVQCLLGALPGYAELAPALRWAAGMAGLLTAGILLAVAEGVLVRLNWRRVPSFVAFGLALSFIAAMVAAARG